MLKDEQAKLEKVRAELIELSERKSNIAKELNVKLLEVDSKAKAVLASAQDQAKSIVEEAQDTLKIAQASSFKARLESDELLATAKRSLEASRLQELSLSNDRIDLDAERVAFQSEMKRRHGETNSLEAHLNERNALLREREISYSTKMSAVDRREAKLAEDVIKLEQAQTILKSRQEKLELDKNAVIVREEELKKLTAETNNLATENKAIRIQLDADTAKTSKLFEECCAIKNNQDAEKDIIKEKFKVLEKTNRDVEEKKQLIKEKTELLEMKSREVDEKIATLQNLRNKK